MNDIEKGFYEVIGRESKTKFRVFKLFKDYGELNYIEVAEKIGIAESIASLYLNELEEYEFLKKTRHGYFTLNGRNLAHAVSNALSQKAAQLSNQSLDLKLSAEAVS